MQFVSFGVEGCRRAVKSCDSAGLCVASCRINVENELCGCHHVDAAEIFFQLAIEVFCSFTHDILELETAVQSSSKALLLPMVALVTPVDDIEQAVV